MANTGIAKVQHYVPQFILKKFCTGKKPQLWVYDKHNDRCFKSHVKNIASETSFYDIDIDDTSYTYEIGLGELETISAPILKRIVKEGNISFLSDDDRAVLSYFFSIQFVRTKQHRQMFKHIHESLEEFLLRDHNDINNVEGWSPLNDQTLKLHGMQAIENAVQFIPYFLNKKWVLMKAKPSNPFLTSDHPVCMHNSKDFGPRGNLGLDVQGIEIYFPISKDYCITMYCPSIERELLEGYEYYKNALDKHPEVVPMFIDEQNDLELLVDGLENGVSVEAMPENILFMNSLHVRNSHRFIFSPNKNFEMVKDILNEHPDLKTGSKPVSN